MNKMSISLIVGLLVLTNGSLALCKSLNLTQFLKEKFDPRSYQYQYVIRDAAETRDVSYLPEEDYIEDFESRAAEELPELQRNNRNLMPEYRNLCEIVTRKVQLTDADYEYQPPHYHEVYCKNYSLLDQTERVTKPSKQKCAHPSFHCVQRSRTLFMVRRRWDSECWEPFTKEIPSGCDCMWPVSSLGDITAHY